MIDHSVVLTIPSELSSVDCFAAEQLTETIHEHTGVRLLLEIRSDDSDDFVRKIRLCLVPTKQRASRSVRIQVPDNAEGYSLNVSSKEIILAARTERGLFYGVQTLKQLLVPVKKTPHFHGAVVRDWPRLALRGLIHSLSKVNIGGRSKLYAVADEMAWNKANTMVLGIDFSVYRVVLAAGGSRTITMADILDLQSYFTERHIQLIPMLGSLAGAAAFNRRGYDLLEEYYAQILPLFRSPYFCASLAEPCDSNSSENRKVLMRAGNSDSALSHIRKIRGIAEKYGKTLIVGSDLLGNDLKILTGLPQRVLVLVREDGLIPVTAISGALSRAGLQYLICSKNASELKTGKDRGLIGVLNRL